MALEAAPTRRWLGEVAPIRHLDPTLIFVSIGLTIYGLLMVYSATHRALASFGDDPGFYLKKQLAFMMLGLIVLVFSSVLDYRLVKVYAPFIFGICGFFLFLVLTPLGSETAGAQRWLTLFGFQFQPSEITKLAMIAMLAAYLSEIRGPVRIDHVWRATGLTLIPMLLVVLQPDIGTSMMFAVILVTMLIVSGAKAKQIGILALAALIALFAAFRLGVVQEYQIERLTGFLDPANDPLRAGYNRAQAEIAIGAGGLFGTGYGSGTQTNLDFVPEQHTDFIFTVVGEEFGFVGSVLLLSMYGILLWRGFRVAMLSKDTFGSLLALGIVGMLAFQVFVNVGMTVGIMPITGIPLPFLSYGGTALLTNFLAVGLLLNVHMRRFK
ncbi:MAG TPA: rod shape-determining protein RodA [Actinomycetota bacterium]|nr:rod shape-determining protein RodA [Actinomycetota bacterium]